MSSKTRYGLLMVIVAAGAISGYLYLHQSDEQTQQVAHAIEYSASSEQPLDGSAQKNSTQMAVELAVQYLESYGDTIADPVTQARLYNERRALMEKYPEDGAHLFESAIETAFPELHEDIMVLMANLDRYNTWLDDNELRLHALPTLKQEMEIWQQREAIFGALASQIWGEEESYLEEKSQVFRKKVAHLENANELQLTELAHQLQTSAEEVYGGDMSLQFVGSGALGHALFSLESVQHRLEQMPSDKRQQAINDLRLQLGYSEGAVERMAKQDQIREAKWQKGEVYSAERDALIQRLSGEDLDQALGELREKHFGMAAPTIAREEEDGFYRFDRPRQYGLN